MRIVRANISMHFAPRAGRYARHCYARYDATERCCFFPLIAVHVLLQMCTPPIGRSCSLQERPFFVRREFSKNVRCRTDVGPLVPLNISIAASLEPREVSSWRCVLKAMFSRSVAEARMPKETRTIHDTMQTPDCDRCGASMTWKSVQLVHARPVNIFYCAHCDQMAAQSVPNAKLVAAS